MNLKASIFLTTALPCEAKPLIVHFDLKKVISLHAFEIYRNDRLCLTVTGPGKNAMSAGLAYTQALCINAVNPIMINVGVAGHQTHEIGSVWTANKISDRETDKNFYPMPVFGLPCSSTAIMTASKPQLDYDHDYLCDMEASAFYETAARFSTGELINCLKVVSDNRFAPGDTLNPKDVEALIRNNTDLLESLIERLEARAHSIQSATPPHYEALVLRYRMTASEQIRLKNVLTRLSVLTGDTGESIDTGGITTGKALLNLFENQLNNIEYTL